MYEKEYILLFCSYLVTFISIHFLIKNASRLNLVDHPNYRKIHNSHFHIEHENISNSIKKFYESIKNKSFHNLDNKFTYLYEFIKTLIMRIATFKRKSK